jgi:hypothetical protein
MLVCIGKFSREIRPSFSIPCGFLLSLLPVAGFGTGSAGEVVEDGGLDAAVDSHDWVVVDVAVLCKSWRQ